MKYVKEKEAPLDDYDIPNGGFGGAFVCEREREIIKLKLHAESMKHS
jgi:hypothetical protein